MKRTRGSETSQYPEEEKSNEILLVAASERGRAQTDPTTDCSTFEVQGSTFKDGAIVFQH